MKADNIVSYGVYLVIAMILVNGICNLKECTAVIGMTHGFVKLLVIIYSSLHLIFYALLGVINFFKKETVFIVTGIAPLHLLILGILTVVTLDFSVSEDDLTSMVILRVLIFMTSVSGLILAGYTLRETTKNSEND